MKKIYCAMFSALLLNTMLSFTAQAQGLIINEFSNGGSGAKEYVELLVVGSTTQKTGMLNLSNWIIDDNGAGALSDNITGIGISNGHIRLSASCFSNIPIGAIIVIYNAEEPHINMPADDWNDANEDGVYIIPHTSACLEYCASYPSVSSSGGNSHYGLPNCNGAGYLGNRTWGFIGLANNNDGLQTRKPTGELYHALGYGLRDYASSSLDISLGGGLALNNFIGNTQYAFQYNCGQLAVADSYERINFANATPGAANSVKNANVIENIRNGNFNYADWTDVHNCDLALPLKLLSFRAQAQRTLENQLTWTLATVDPMSKVYIQRSADAVNFETIAVLDLQSAMENQDYNYQDYSPFYTTYYRLKFEEPNAPISYSLIQVAVHQLQAQAPFLQLYPNPTTGDLNIFLERGYGFELNYKVIDQLGRTLQIGTLEAQQIYDKIPVNTLVSGIYYLQFSDAQGIVNTAPFIKY